MPNIFNVWNDESWEEPLIEEKFDPDRTVLLLRFKEKQAIKTSDKKQAKKTIENMDQIRKYLRENGESKTSDIADNINLSEARTRMIISYMDDIVSLGSNKNRKYKLK